MLQDAGIGYNPEFYRKAMEARARKEQYKQANEVLRREAERRTRLANKLADVDAFRAVREMIPRSEFQRIERRASMVFNLRLVHIRGRSRQKDLSLARHFICYWAARKTSLSLPQIGRLLGGRDHTSILHGVRAYREKRAKMGRNLPSAR